MRVMIAVIRAAQMASQARIGRSFFLGGADPRNPFLGGGNPRNPRRLARRIASMATDRVC